MKKILSLTLVMMMLFTFASIGSFADDGCTAYPYITMDNSNDFTQVMTVDGTTAMKVVGLSASYVKSDFVGDEIDYITWTTSDESVVVFDVAGDEYDEVSEADVVTIVAKGQGSATITITYDTPDDNPVSVTSNVTVEGNTVISSVTPITISVDGVNTDDFTMTNATVPLFRLKDIYGTTYNDSDVLKKQPTALHGLLYALECHYDSDGTTDITNGSWDWDWVSANVDVTSQGTYVSGIGSDDNNYTVGWQYKVNTVSQSEAASINPLSSNDGLTWEFTTFSW